MVAIAALTLTGCAQKNDTPEAVKQGVIRDLAKKFDMSKMDVIVDSVSFRDKEADATVTFAIKGGSAAQGMTMKYVMERHDDNQWYIKARESQAGAGAPQGDAGATPAGHPAMGGTPGATPSSGSKLNLPPDHPEIGQ
jgi:ribosomal protein S6E (S10)